MFMFWFLSCDQCKKIHIWGHWLMPSLILPLQGGTTAQNTFTTLIEEDCHSVSVVENYWLQLGSSSLWANNLECRVEESGNKKGKLCSPEYLWNSALNSSSFQQNVK